MRTIAEWIAGSSPALTTGLCGKMDADGLDLRSASREADISAGAGLMVKWAAKILVVALLVSCTTAQSYGYRSRYQGVHVDHFFLEWGAPVASHKLKDGGKIYLWFSGRDSAYIPGHTDSELIGNTAWWRGYPLREYAPEWACRVRIVANPDGTIREILMHDDSRNWWQGPRCRAVFGPPIPWTP
jgi:hypothetical protein